MMSYSPTCFECLDMHQLQGWMFFLQNKVCTESAQFPCVALFLQIKSMFQFLCGGSITLNLRCLYFRWNTFLGMFVAL